MRHSESHQKLLDMNFIRPVISGINAISKNHKVLFFLFLAILMISNTILLFTERMGVLAGFAFMLLPIGIQMMLLASVRRPGLMFLFLLPKSVLDAFQFVLIALYGGSIIAVDMFLNVVTTNPTEASELLTNLAPAIITLLVIYIPAILVATISLKKDCSRYNKSRILFLKSGLAITVCGFICFAGAHLSKRDFEAKYDIYPINVFYNMDFAIRKWNKIDKFSTSSSNFKYDASIIQPQDSTSSVADSHTNERKIYVVMVGETARAHNWSLYGYERKTTPHIDTTSNLIKFRALTQSNTTHKSVPMLLTPADAGNYEMIYQCKSIITLFKECGFKTAYITNHNYNGTFMGNYFKEADIAISIRNQESDNNYDYPVTEALESVIAQNRSCDLFIVMHIYGSHFRYSERYSQEFAKWLPDRADVISPKYEQELINGYDNSILSTDHIIDKTINILNRENCKSFTFYTSDHGEDLMDDKRKRFLHASPLPTAHQLNVPFIFWYSNKYRECEESKISVTLRNSEYTISSNASLFHTVAGLASIGSKYVNERMSLCSEKFNAQPLLYLTDHDGCIEIGRLPMKRYDWEFLRDKNLLINERLKQSQKRK